MKIHLKKEMETLIIPLYGRARMSEKGILSDAYAEEAIKKLDYNFKSLAIREKTQVMLSLRSMIIDDYAGDYLLHNPDSTVLHLGCGLDSRYFRIGRDTKNWYDLDFPEVIALKKQLYAETVNFRYISSSVTDPGWADSVTKENGSILVIAEGLFMYLSGTEIKSLLQMLKTQFGEYTIIFDAYSALTAKRAGSHPSIKKTHAEIKWGIDAADDMSDYAGTAEHIETFYFTDPDAIIRLPAKYRRLFKFAGRFKTAREAHRIFVFEIST